MRVSADWRHGLPSLASDGVVLRDLRESDAPSLFRLLTTREVTRFISPPPSSVDGFRQFIAWSHRHRTAGTNASFAITLEGRAAAIGLIQVRQLEPGFSRAEWGFALGSPFWGTGIFQRSAQLVVDFAFDHLGVRRLEARAAVQNGRGCSALQKLGAIGECRLRRSLHCGGEYLDEVLYSILDEDRRPRDVSAFDRPVRVAAPLAPRADIQFRATEAGMFQSQ